MVSTALTLEGLLKGVWSFVEAPVWRRACCCCVLQVDYEDLSPEDIEQCIAVLRENHIKVVQLRGVVWCACSRALWPHRHRGTCST